uniref:Uncharacterized protein n=1 Tax=Amorphochlora amoebiformis TaxID=1561963 RepID=A0A7S0H1J5_9EUKA
MTRDLVVALKDIFSRYTTSHETSMRAVDTLCLGSKSVTSNNKALRHFFTDPLFDSKVLDVFKSFLDESAMWDQNTLQRYISELGGTLSPKQRARNIMEQYGDKHVIYKDNKALSRWVKEGSSRRGTRNANTDRQVYYTLSLRGFLQMYEDACKDRPVAVRSDLRAFGYDSQLQKM